MNLLKLLIVAALLVFGNAFSQAVSGAFEGTHLLNMTGKPLHFSWISAERNAEQNTSGNDPQEYSYADIGLSYPDDFSVRYAKEIKVLISGDLIGANKVLSIDVKKDESQSNYTKYKRIYQLEDLNNPENDTILGEDNVYYNVGSASIGSSVTTLTLNQQGKLLVKSSNTATKIILETP